MIPLNQITIGLSTFALKFALKFVKLLIKIGNHRKLQQFPIKFSRPPFSSKFK